MTDGYVALKLYPGHGRIIHKILKKHGVKGLIPYRHMHMTLMYDKDSPSTDYTPSKEFHSAKLKTTNDLGDPGTKWHAMVLELDGPSITKRHKALKDSGLKHSHKDFIQHVSLKYKPSKEDISALKKALPEIKKALPELRLAQEYSEALSEKTSTIKAAMAKDICAAVTVQLDKYPKKSIVSRY